MSGTPAGDGGTRDDSGDPTYHTDEIGPDERASEAVVRAVGAVTGRSPLELDPLFEVVDPDALDALFEPPPDEEARTDVRVTLRLGGCEVTIEGRRMRIRDVDDGTPR